MSIYVRGETRANSVDSLKATMHQWRTDGKVLRSTSIVSSLFLHKST